LGAIRNKRVSQYREPGDECKIGIVFEVEFEIKKEIPA